MNSTAYKKSGVDTKAGMLAVDRIKKHVKKTLKSWDGEILSDIGGFGGVVKHKDGTVSGYATDGVGTKLLLAIILDKHENIGQDLVAMSANDLAVIGIEPKVFLDYIAQGKQDPAKTEIIVKGIAKACVKCNMILIGGEMAEMPGIYKENHYDLAGFAVGFAKSENNLITGKQIKPGMKIYGYPSSGIHANGFSLIRKIFGISEENKNRSKRILNKFYPQLSKTLAEELLEPTALYPKIIKKLISNHKIAGLAHITGGGLVENPPRILTKNLACEFNLSLWKLPPIFKLLQEKGDLSQNDMLSTFNCGAGFIVVTNEQLPKPYFLMGNIVKSKSNKSLFVGNFV